MVVTLPNSCWQARFGLSIQKSHASWVTGHGCAVHTPTADLSNFGEVSQIEGIVALGRRGQQLSTDSVVGLHSTGHNGAAQRLEVSRPVCQEAPKDGGQDGFDGCIRWGWHTQLGEVAHKAGAQGLPTPSCSGHSNVWPLENQDAMLLKPCRLCMTLQSCTEMHASRPDDTDSLCK